MKSLKSASGNLEKITMLNKAVALVPYLARGVFKSQPNIYEFFLNLGNNYNCSLSLQKKLHHRYCNEF